MQKVTSRPLGAKVAPDVLGYGTLAKEKDE